MLDRNQILQRAYDECLAEMYAKAQPSADYYQLCEDVKNGKIDKNERVYERYYLSHEEFNYIRQKYIDAYGIKEHWESNIKVLEDYLNNGGTKDKYIESHTDENGHYHPGYRGYEKVKSIKEQIYDILKKYIIENNCEKIRDKITEAVTNTITDCKEFYRFDREQSNFSCSVALGPSPTSNPKTVIEYWKSQGVDIEIKERNPLLFWEQDYYEDEFEEVMIDEYGEDWEDEWNNKWKEDKKRELSN